MKKYVCILLALIIIAALSACASNTVRDRSGLPQSTRVDRTAFVRTPSVTDGTATATGGTAAVTGGTATATDGTAAATDGTATAVTPDPSATDTPEEGRTTFFTRDDGTIVFHLSHQNEPAHPLHIGLLYFKEEVERRSEGAIVVEIFYGGAIAGDVAAINMVNANQLDAAAITSWGTWPTELADLESLPFKFTNYEEAWAAYEGTFGEWVARNIVEPYGARVLGHWTNGLRHFTNNVRPIYTPDDMIGLRMRSPQRTGHLAMYEAFGAASLSIPLGDLYAALSEGRADGQDNPLGNIYATRFYEVQRYLSLSNHMFTSGPLIVSNEFWYSLSDEHQQILLDSSAVASRFQGELTRDTETQQLANIAAFGTQINTINKEPFFDIVEQIWQDNMNRFGNEIAVIASRYISDPTALAHRFSD